MIEFNLGNLRVPKFQRPVYMVAAGTTDCRKRYPECKLKELTMMAFKMLLEENDLKADPLETKGLINMAVYGEFADHFQDQLLCEAKVHDYLGLDPLPNVGIKTGGATGGYATLIGANTIASGYSNCTLVLGWERMDEVDTRTGNLYISTAACKDFETRPARMFAAHCAPMARCFSHVSQVKEESRAAIAAKNWNYAFIAPLAGSPGKMKVEEALASHLMEDGSTAFVGTGIPMLAAALAKRTHAPNLLAIFEFGGTGTSLKQLPPGVGDSRTFRRLRLDSSLTRRYSVCPPSQQVVMVKTPRRSHVDHVSH